MVKSIFKRTPLILVIAAVAVYGTQCKDESELVPAGKEIAATLGTAATKALSEANNEIAKRAAEAVATAEAGDQNKSSKNSAAPLTDVNCYVVKISDGDTATCLDANKKQIKIRFAEIDAPESKQEFGTVAKQALSNKIFNKNIDLKIYETDRYGRSLAEVYLDGENINQYMVKNGYAWAYKEYLKDKQYLEYQQAAQNKKIGLWSHKNPVYPQDFRREQIAKRQAAK